MNAQMPLVTVAIPIYNAANYLEQAIQSVLNQTYKNFELILLNDGSTDDSVRIMNSFSDSRIRIINDGENKGLVERLNQSISLARGKYYARMDADDIMHPERLAKQISFLEENPCMDLVGCSYYLIDANNKICSVTNLPEVPKREDIIYNKSFLHPSVTAKLEWFSQNKYDDKFIRIEDKELWLRTHRLTKWFNLKEPLMFYRAFGVPAIRKYLITQKYNFDLMYYYRKEITFGLFVKECIKTLLKIGVYTLFTLCKAQNFLIGLRGSKIDCEDALAGTKKLEIAISDNLNK